MDKPATINPSLTVNEGKVWASSLDVAEAFEKRHDNVLRDIDQLEIPDDFRLLNFEETVKTRPNPATGGQLESRAVLMTRDGFTLLAMGFTGKRAMRFKIAYIEAFNRMEAELRGRGAEGAAPYLPGIPARPTQQVDRGRPGPDWFTVKEVAPQWGLRDNSARKILRQMVRDGQAEVVSPRDPKLPKHYRFLAEGEKRAEEARECKPDCADAMRGKRFLAVTDETGRFTFKELIDDRVFSMKDLPKLLTDPAFVLGPTTEEHKKRCIELAMAATLRANFGGNIAGNLLYGNESEKRTAIRALGAKIGVPNAGDTTH